MAFGDGLAEQDEPAPNRQRGVFGKPPSLAHARGVTRIAVLLVPTGFLPVRMGLIGGLFRGRRTLGRVVLSGVQKVRQGVEGVVASHFQTFPCAYD